MDFSNIFVVVVPSRLSSVIVITCELGCIKLSHNCSTISKLILSSLFFFLVCYILESFSWAGEQHMSTSLAAVMHLYLCWCGQSLTQYQQHPTDVIKIHPTEHLHLCNQVPSYLACCLSSL